MNVVIVNREDESFYIFYEEELTRMVGRGRWGRLEEKEEEREGGRGNENLDLEAIGKEEWGMGR
jgi:hypothetical protein